MKLLCIQCHPGGDRCWLDQALSGHEVDYRDRPGGLEVVRTRRVDAVLLPFDPADDLVEQVRQLAPNLPVIALGLEDTALAAAQALAHGALGYVVRPADGELSPARQVLTDLVQRAAAKVRFETERETVLRENLRMSKFYGDVITSVNQGIVVIDHEGKIRFRNPVAEQILGEGAGEGDGEAGPQAAVPLLEVLVETLTRGETQNQMIALEQGEQKVFLDVTAAVLRSADGKTTGAVATVADRSIEKHLEQQLVHTERLATLGSLLASIAHEINNTLTSVTGCAEMGLELADTMEETAREAEPKQRETLGQLGSEIRMIFDMVLEAGISAQTVANNMLQYSRQGKPSHRVQENINSLIERTLAMLGKHVGVEKVSLELQLDRRTPYARIEPSKLQQALINLIVNAVHALLDHKDPARRALLISTLEDRDRGEAVISVRDSGPGISRRNLERIFQPFFTTKGHGTGLGLYITRKVVEDQGGQIEVESAVGEGTTVSIRLPLARTDGGALGARVE